MKPKKQEPTPCDDLFRMRLEQITASLEQVHKLTGIAPKEVYVDRGYRGHAVTDTVKVWIAGARRGVTVAIKKRLLHNLPASQINN
ncbi:hypothetical protein [Nitrosomonas sp. Nm33]|uniref:hypothetical protein n=1 Tax=Nitrosomonas sp. Nm33 TaxID=133724 RepID=UPI00089D2AC3|nr:hypothetical protein [Nitrosomonas sp. Nm33]SDY59873.1 hypothetical protein SAMN05421755_103231 [Nitrosomonas sp. Nm33]